MVADWKRGAKCLYKERIEGFVFRLMKLYDQDYNIYYVYAVYDNEKNVWASRYILPDNGSMSDGAAIRYVVHAVEEFLKEEKEIKDA